MFPAVAGNFNKCHMVDADSMVDSVSFFLSMLFSVLFSEYIKCTGELCNFQCIQYAPVCVANICNGADVNDQMTSALAHVPNARHPHAECAYACILKCGSPTEPCAKGSLCAG